MDNGKLQAALVIPSLTLEDLMSLDFSALLSEEVPIDIDAGEFSH